ncbi:hypothetical protein FHS89_001921 [Rubricella aquisinus]|uniref:CoA-binding domain-containing protein n=1 Tax=Rubricella aquisinus TaxID=2028108 RepID=A0A840WMU5_9RHOB|nr:CoA-binding protein [Rubricella aquisinus]MBB5515901.1 hypothetical protein [Rubricella aquisinus]
MDESYTDDHLRKILRRTKTVACVGVSLNEVRPSYFVARYLKLKQFRVIGVNPGYAGQTGFGDQIVASLGEIPAAVGPVHMVDIFRRSEQAGAVVDEALDALLDRGLQTIWMQIGVTDPDAAARAREKGVDVIMNRCPKIEYQRLFGELRWGGIATGIISSKLK